jgi:hypothetical protein
LGDHATAEFFNAYTSASLIDVRVVRIYVGASGYSRGVNDVSGILLEYHNQDKPVIVGQCIEECGYLELSPGERITETSLWIWNTWNDKSWAQANIGITSGIRIVTSKRQAVEVVHDSPGQMRIKFCNNHFEELVCILTKLLLITAPDKIQNRIIWVFNSSWDHVRVCSNQVSKENDKPSFFLSFPPAPGFTVEKIFWQYDTDGNESAVTSIEISFNNTIILGISFVYASGLVSTLGYNEGETAVMKIEPGEELIRFDWDFVNPDGCQHMAVSYITRCFECSSTKFT